VGPAKTGCHRPAPDRLALATARHPPTVVATLVGQERGLEVRGELDLATAPLVAAAFADRGPGNGPGSRYLLDLSDLTFLDVRGIRVLSDIDTEMDEVGDYLQVNPPASAEADQTLRLAVSLGWVAAIFTRLDLRPA
jgi:anti-anti-sigma regulatory factor